MPATSFAHTISVALAAARGRGASKHRRASRLASSTRDDALRAILRLDDAAREQLETSVEGRRVIADIPLDVLAARVRVFSRSLPPACAGFAFDIITERPGLMCDDEFARTSVATAASIVGGDEKLGELCEECAPACAHVIWEIGCLGKSREGLARSLREWIGREEGWHRVFVSRVASQWGYLRTMQRTETTTMAGKGEVYRNVRTGESVTFREQTKHSV